MNHLIKVPLESGGTILIEAEGSGSSEAMRGIGAKKVIDEVTQTLEAALDNVKATANAVISRLRDIPQAPEEVTVEFGIKFGAKADVYIAKGDAEANFKVALKWKKETPLAVPIEAPVKPDEPEPPRPKESRDELS